MFNSESGYLSHLELLRRSIRVLQVLHRAASESHKLLSEIRIFHEENNFSHSPIQLRFCQSRYRYRFIMTSVHRIVGQSEIRYSVLRNGILTSTMIT